MSTTEQMKALLEKLRSADPEVRMAGLLSLKAVLTTVLLWIDKAIERERGEKNGNEAAEKS